MSPVVVASRATPSPTLRVASFSVALIKTNTYTHTHTERERETDAQEELILEAERERAEREAGRQGGGWVDGHLLHSLSFPSSSVLTPPRS